LKRFVAIFFLFLFLFNIGGYYLVFLAMESKAKNDLLSRLDARAYTPDETLTLSIPLSMPYPINTGEYEGAAGEFYQDGNFYKLMSQKVENDTLFILCIRDDRSARIVSAFQDFSKAANNLPVASKEAMNFLAKLYKDYDTSEFVFRYKSRFLFAKTYYAYFMSSPDDVPSVVDTPPPQQKA
jgi:hypothetical protein